MRLSKIIPTILMLTALFGCQTEESLVESAPGNRLIADSNLENLIARVVQNETGFDNVVDGTSCFGIQFPYTVIVNQQTIYVDSPEDYAQITDILGASTDDFDTISIVYPISISYPDFTTTSIYSQEQFNAVLEGCGQAAQSFSEITCVDFNYPITINTYDSDNQVADSVEITSNGQLYDFLMNVSSSDIIAIAYPVSLTSVQGITTMANSNAELETAIENSIGTCGQPVNMPSLSSVFINGGWVISYYYHNEDETSDYNGFTFSFSPTGIVTAVKDGESYNGNWVVHQQGGQTMVDIDFNDSELGDLDDDWRVLEYSENEVRLRQDNGGSGGDRLYFSKI